MAFLVELFGIVSANVTETRTRDGSVADAVGQNAVNGLQIEGLYFATASETTAVVIETTCIKGNVTCGINLLVNVHEKITTEAAAVLFLRCCSVPHGVIRPFGGTVLTFLLPAISSVDSVTITSRSKQVDAQFLLLPHVTHPWRNERLVRAVHTKTDELVALDVG